MNSQDIEMESSGLIQTFIPLPKKHKNSNNKHSEIILSDALKIVRDKRM